MSETAFNWIDTTSYAKGERGVADPSTFSLDSEGVLLVVTRHIHTPGKWTMLFEGDSRRELKFEAIHDAKEEALAIARKRVFNMAKALGLNL
jgi:hypothetical protein